MFGSSRQRTSAIDDAVEAYESARGRDGRAELEAFLPAPDHPLYLAVLCELVRVDLEYGYEERRPGRLEDYERRFPELFRDPGRAREVAFEEFRLRKEAGESPSPSAYRDRYGVDDLDWPATTPGPEPTVEKSPPASADPSDCQDWGTDGASWNTSTTQAELRRPIDDVPIEPPRRRTGRHRRLIAAGILIAASAATIAAGILARQRGIERLQAREALDRMTAQLGQAEFLLSLPDAPARKIGDGIALCRRAVEVYGAGTDPRWPERAPASRLSGEDRARLRRGVGELLGLWARALTWRAETSADRRAERIAEVERLIALAEASNGSAGASRELKRQSAVLARLAGRKTEAERLRAEAEAITPITRHERLALVSSYLDRGMDREALALAEDVSRLDPLDASAWLIRGQCLARVAQPERADPCFSIGIELQPGLVWAYLDRGHVALDRREFDRAIADFDRVLGLSHDQPEALLERAFANMERGDAPAAIADLDRLLERADAPTRALFLRVRAHEARGDKASASADRREGLARIPGDELSWVMRGLNQLPADPAAALEDFRAARKLNPKSLPSFQAEATVLIDTLGRTEEAVAVLNQALAHHPQSAPNLAVRSVLLARLGRREESLKDAEASRALDDSAAILFRAACAYALTSQKEPGDEEEALRLLALVARKDGIWLGAIDTDPDLAPLRARYEFRRLRDALGIVCKPDDRPK